jgi:GT2 family glycosyltransferase/LmbE family N-acetylglucosaminyl deacetylase
MRLLVLAPHPDDDVLGCGGWIHRLTAEGRSRIRVVFLTSGGLAGEVSQREREALAALNTLGVSDAQFWRFPDGALPESAVVGERILDLVQGWRPNTIALPSTHDAHPDHRRLTRVALNHLTGKWAGELLFYETTQPISQPNHYVAIDLDVKLAALQHHASQLALYDYVRTTKAIASLRGTAMGTLAAEAFISFVWDGSSQAFFTDRPLVSVVMRSDDVALLNVAIASLEAQIYDPIELIIVWHGCEPKPVIQTWLRHFVIRGPGGRAANLNAGLDQAQGRFLAFLDQDDVLLPDHLATLVGEMDATPTPDLVHARYQVATCMRESLAIRVLSTADPAGEDRPSASLLIENHIPIHSYLIERKTARALRFDESLDAYEDWDFLIRLSLSGAVFRFCDAVLCEYRIYPTENEDATLLASHSRKGFLPQMARIQAKLEGPLQSQAFRPLQELARSLLHQGDTRRDQITDLRKQVADLTLEVAQHTQTQSSLARWSHTLLGDHADSDSDEIINRLAARAFSDGPWFDIVVPVYNPVPEFLDDCVKSVLAQHYPRWTLWLVDDGSTDPAVVERLATWAESCATSAADANRTTTQQIRVNLCADNHGIVAVTNRGVALGEAPWVVFVDHDDRLHPQALLELAACIETRAGLDLVYTDSRTVDRTGAPLTTLHKPDWSPETLWHINYINHLCAVRREAFNRVGGLLPGTDGSQDWDLVLRVGQRSGSNVAHISKVLYDWRVSEHSVAYRSSIKPYAITAAARAVAPILADVVGSSLKTESAVARAGLRHRWKGTLQPLTVIIPTHDNATDLAALLSFLHRLDRTDLSIVLMANNVHSADMLNLLQHWSQVPRMTIRHHDKAFNWSELNNVACKSVTTPDLLFLNDDIELGALDTLDHLQSHLALDPKIGAVGALLRYPNADGGDIQHDGVITHPQWVARNISNPADCSALYVPRNVAAVTGACLLTRREAFEAVGGFEPALASSFNDVDYCLKLRQSGYRIMQASDVQAVHRESRSRGAVDSVAKLKQLEAELHWMQRRWGDMLVDQCNLRETDRYMGSLIVNIPASP